ncbi:MAG: TRAP transporter small permease [Treponema sp.]|jgi:TRAP-type C4-dicarboxylate transport system permease small subunit|nr:TRAP transporter small permease [Treponema sp.]
MKALKWLDLHLEEVILTICLCALTVLTSVNVVLRYIFNTSLTWSDEICKDCLIYSCFFSIGWWIRRKNGIAVDALVQFLPLKIKSVFSWTVQFILIGFLILAFRASVTVLQGVAASDQVSGTLQISMVYVYITPAAGFGLALFRSVQVLILEFKKSRRGK